jgi:hypothetical protein
MLSIEKLNAESEKAATLERKINNDAVMQIARMAESMITAREKVATDFVLVASSVAKAQRQAAEMMVSVGDKVGPALRQIEELERLARQYRPYNFNASEFTRRTAVVTSPALLELQRQHELPKRTIVRREVRRRIGFAPPTTKE